MHHPPSHPHAEGLWVTEAGQTVPRTLLNIINPVWMVGAVLPAAVVVPPPPARVKPTVGTWAGAGGGDVPSVGRGAPRAVSPLTLSWAGLGLLLRFLPNAFDPPSAGRGRSGPRRCLSLCWGCSVPAGVSWSPLVEQGRLFPKSPSRHPCQPSWGAVLLGRAGAASSGEGALVRREGKPEFIRAHTAALQPAASGSSAQLKLLSSTEVSAGCSKV